CFFFQAEDGIRDDLVTGVQTCALPISFTTFRRITLPAIRWAVAYGVVLTTARSLGEFGAVAMVGGNIAGQTQTLTLYVQASYDNGTATGAYAASVLLAALAMLTLTAMTMIRPREEAHGDRGP